MFVNIDDEHAEIFALLVNAVETRFVDEAGRWSGLAMNAPDASAPMVVRSKSCSCPGARDEETGLVNDQRGRRIRARDECA